MTRESLVLLKNDGLLPLKAPPRRIAVIGPNADSVEALAGNYNGTPKNPVTVLAGLKARFPKADITYVEGTGWVTPPMHDVPAANLCADQACSKPGLTFEKFDGPDLAGSPVKTSTVATAALSWGWTDSTERGSSARWTGYLRASESGVHSLRIGGNPGYRIMLDGKTVTDAWDVNWPASGTKVTLEAGKTYRLTIEARQRDRSGSQALQWSVPSAGDEAALAAAREADLVVFASGLTAELEGEEMPVSAPGFAGGDRTSLDLPAPQEGLLQRLGETGKPIVLVNLSGSAMELNWEDKHVPAIIQAWYPGGDGGTAIAELIAGDFSPAGRLPVTFYKSVNQLPPFEDYSMNERTYRRFTGKPLYPFGYGLSYTSFAYGKAKASSRTIKAGEGVSVSVDLRNTGKRAGDEVVQVYVSRPGPDAPIRSLAAFRRVHLATGEVRKITFDLDGAAFSTVDSAGQRTVEGGPAQLWIGGGQPASAGGAALKIRIAGRIPDVGESGDHQ